MRPRIRTLKPEMWHDEKVGGLSHGARLLFVGLITMADDEGRLRELPGSILGHVFPYNDVNLQKLRRWLNEIVSAGLVERYEHERRPYLNFANWARHQRINRPSPSELPPPPAVNDQEAVTDDSVKVHGKISESSPPHAQARVPDPDPSFNSSSSREIHGKAKAEGNDSLTKARELFAYWQEKCGHPNAKRSQERLSKIQARLKDGHTPDDIRKAIDGAAAGAFVNDNGRRFDDIELICRSSSKLESFIDRTATPAGVNPALPEWQRPRPEWEAQVKAHLEAQGA